MALNRATAGWPLAVVGRCRQDQFTEALRHHRHHFGEVGRLRTGGDVLVDDLVDLAVQAFGHDAYLAGWLAFHPEI